MFNFSSSLGLKSAEKTSSER